MNFNNFYKFKIKYIYYNINSKLKNDFKFSSQLKW
jgi:hypothetical protein